MTENSQRQPVIKGIKETGDVLLNRALATVCKLALHVLKSRAHRGAR